jgi:hypothetical protein
VDVDDEREKVRLGFELSDKRERDCLRAMASIEFFLVCDGDLLGMAGASVGVPCMTAVPGATKYEDKWLALSPWL